MQGGRLYSIVSKKKKVKRIRVRKMVLGAKQQRQIIYTRNKSGLQQANTDLPYLLMNFHPAIFQLLMTIKLIQMRQKCYWGKGISSFSNNFLPRGHRLIDFAINGEMAYERVLQQVETRKKVSYKLIFMDLEMPVMDGIESAKKIGQLILKGKTKIIACSAYSDQKQKSKSFDAGMDDYLEKPIRLNVLDEILNKYGDLFEQ